MRSLLLLLLTACIPAMEQHGGAAPIPSKMPDVGFAAIGATVDQSLLWAKVPFAPRVAVDAVAAFMLRNVSTFGRTADSGLLFVIGIWPPEFLHFIQSARREPR